MGKEYCKLCGQVINIKKGFMSRFGGGDQDYQEFEDGYYCIPCTKIRVATMRKGK